MGITRAQIARQLLAQGGMSLNDAKTMAPKGEFLAYINPEEAQMLKDAGGSGIMTPMGIPSFVDFGGAGSGYGSAQDTFDSAAGRGGSRTGSGGGQGPSRSDTGTGTDDVYQGSSETNQSIAKVNRTLGQKIVDSIKGISKFTPFGIARKGLGFLFDKLANLRGFNPDGTRRTQAQYEQARQDRINQNRISNIMGRDAPFTQMTLDNLAKLGYDGPLEGLIGSTNTTRSGTSDQNFPDRVEGIVSQAPTTFRDAMANLNLERGVPRDQVFLSAKDFIDQNKTISSENLGTVQQNIKDATGYNTTPAKTFGLEELLAAKAGETGFFGGLTDQGKALEDFRNSAVNFKNAPGNPNNTAQSAFQFMMDPVRQNMFKDVQQNKDYIQEQINQGFLQNPEDYINQKALGSYF